MSAGSVSALATVTATQGVRGVVVFDAGGSCIESDLPPAYDLAKMRDLLHRVDGAGDVFSSLGDGPVSAFALACEGGTVIVRRAGGHTVLTLADPSVNVNLLNVALNVLVLNLERMSQSQVELDTELLTAPAEVRSVRRSSQAPELIPPDALGRPVVLRLLEVFTSYMGPAARMVLRQQLDTLGASTRTLRESQYDSLVLALATRIPSPVRKDEFLAAARQVWPGCS